MRKLQEVGLQTPDPQQLPSIIYHDGRNSFPGETMENAAKAGYQKFRVAPQIIFVLLPDNCEPRLHLNLQKPCNSEAERLSNN